MKRFTALLCSAVLISAPTAASAAQFGLNMNLFVPRICTVSALSMAYDDQGVIKVDRIREFCNSGGYQVFLEYAPGTLKGAQARLGNHMVELDGSGQALLVDANYAVSRISSLEIAQTYTNNTNVQIGLRMVPR